MKRFLSSLVILFMIASDGLAMTFSQPIEIGKVDVPLQRGGWGLNIEGAVQNSGNYYRKFIKDSTGYDRGVAQFGNGADALYFHYDYGTVFDSKNPLNPEKYFRLGSKDISNTIGITLGHFGKILKIKTDQFATFYSIRFSYCTSHLHIIGKDKNGKWIRYIDSKKINDKYFNGKDAYKEDGGVIYDQPICRDDSIVVVYRRWHWKGMSEAEGEFRFKWDDKAQWFSVEQVIY